MPAPSASSANGPALLGRIVDDEHAVDARVARPRDEVLDAHRFDRIRVAHEHDGRGVVASRGTPRCSRARRVEASRRACSARSLERWITGPSAIGSENGTPSSRMSAPASTSACISGTVSGGAGSPAVMNGISALRRARGAAARRSPGCAITSCPRTSSPERSATVCMSLSPRPERFTSRIRPVAIVGASFTAYATAWLDSSAGMMPSRRQQLVERRERLVVGRSRRTRRARCP